MIIEDEGGMNLKFFYDNVASRVKSARDPNALELFFRPTRRLKMQTSTFSFRKISLSTIGKGWTLTKLIFLFIFI